MILTTNVKWKAADTQLKLFATICLAAVMLGVARIFVDTMRMKVKSKVKELPEANMNPRNLFATIVNQELGA